MINFDTLVLPSTTSRVKQDCASGDTGFLRSDTSQFHSGNHVITDSISIWTSVMFTVCLGLSHYLNPRLQFYHFYLIICLILELIIVQSIYDLTHHKLQQKQFQWFCA